MYGGFSGRDILLHTATCIQVKIIALVLIDKVVRHRKQRVTSNNPQQQTAVCIATNT